MVILIDITRTLVRFDDPFQTGIGRSERAVVDYALTLSKPIYFIARLSGRLYLFDQAGLKKAFSDVSDGWTKISLRFALRFRLNRSQRQALSCFAQHALLTFRNFDETMQNEMHEPFHYINLGHLNFGNRFARDLKANGCAKVSMFIHDVIPLDHPEYQTNAAVSEFRRFIETTKNYATEIWVNSDYTKTRVAEHLGLNLPIEVYRLGVDPPQEKPHSNDLSAPEPYFLAVGTIEPRKNIGLLIDIWENLKDPPKLIIAGRRGWNSSVVLNRLDELSEKTKWLEYRDDLKDDQLELLYQRAQAVLLPSFVEGFGLPGLEAQAHGVPLICSDISVFKELFSGYADFVDPYSKSEWKALIGKRMKQPIVRNRPIPSRTWQEFAKAILSHE